MKEEPRAIVKVCIHTQCASRGSRALFEKLRSELYDEALVLEAHCFDECNRGPNVTVNGQFLHGLNQNNGVARIRAELEHPSLKSDGVGTRKIDELDIVIEEMTQL